jgi:hypothetical protein
MPAESMPDQSRITPNPLAFPIKVILEVLELASGRYWFAEDWTRKTTG